MPAQIAMQDASHVQAANCASVHGAYRGCPTAETPRLSILVAFLPAPNGVGYRLPIGQYATHDKTARMS